MAQSDASNFPR